MKSRTAFAVALFALALCGRAFAQPKQMPEYGTSGNSSVRFTALDFLPLDSSDYAFGGSLDSLGRYPVSTNSLFASVHVPGGTNITRIELDYCDNSASGNHIKLALVQCDNQGQNCGQQSTGVVSSSNGCSFAAEAGLAIHVDNYTKQYVLVALFDAFDGSDLLTGAIVSYQLEVSPAPGAATFNDVPTNHPFFQYIEALAASGITGGCGSGNYCPDAPLTRGQMAVFLAKALGLYWNNQ
jgi:hypothetical protein